ncbi:MULTISPECIES: hypothetical protein [unclassified Paraburkholderia]|uniref:hypothetical protein n=1 Tax=unclassified Paraburkholderia TaxID=2615204 RepID=UPI00160F19B9|nr:MULTISPECIES: hypothetical protein [unclassified Paraburkholderia]MBB5442266.1 hypothetical protein [Paraburkholderia sp. WSM4177]MBB5482926.1 hypothetical protein [Paraburkholderia sp. WSM4180]
MSKPSERIVVFVTTAQKRAITATAEDLGISVSELMRRAVLSFGATSEQVKAASIVDRLRAPRAPDPLNAALQRVARGTRYARAALPVALQAHEKDAAAPAAAAASAAAGAAGAVDSPSMQQAGRPALATDAADAPAPLLPAGVAAALAAEQDEQAAATAEAVARLTAARAAENAENAEADAIDNAASKRLAGTSARLRNSLKRRHNDPDSDDDEPHGDPSAEGGRFA